MGNRIDLSRTVKYEQSVEAELAGDRKRARELIQEIIDLRKKAREKILNLN